MNKSLCQQLENELNEIVQHHLTALGEFVNSVEPSNTAICNTMQQDLSVLDSLCQTMCESPSREVYTTVCASLNRLRQLLQLLMLNPNSSMFQNSELGNLWRRAHQWCEQFSAVYELSTEEVWALIAPVVPDVLQKLGNNVYEAIWWKSVPHMDIEILQRTEYILAYPPCAASNTPGGVAVRFIVQR